MAGQRKIVPTEQAFEDASIRRLIDTRRKAALMVKKNAQETHITSVKVHRMQDTGLHLTMMLVTCVIAYIVGNERALKSKWANAMHWYAGEPVKGATASEVGGKKLYGFMRGPRPKGRIHFSMQCCASSATYPALDGVMGFLGICPTIPRPAAIFLLTFVNVYFNDVTGVHYSGSAEQLGRANLGVWLSNWSKWQDKKNPFAFMYTSYVAFQNSLARREAVKSVDKDTGTVTVDPTSMLSALYQGGLCHMCGTLFDDNTDVQTAWFHLLGSRAVYYRTCQAERAAKAMQDASTAMMASSAGLSIGYMAFMANGGTTLVTSAMANSFQGISVGSMLWGATFGGGQVATGGALTTTGAADFGDVELTSFASTGAEAASSAAEAAAAGGAEAAAAGATGAAAETASTLGMVSMVNCWNPGGWFLLVAALVATVAIVVGVSVGVASATGVISYYHQKCSGGNYYIIVNGKQVKWDGDVSLLPKNQQRPISGE